MLRRPDRSGYGLRVFISTVWKQAALSKKWGSICQLPAYEYAEIMDCMAAHRRRGSGGKRKKLEDENGRCCGHQAKVFDGPIGRLRSLHQSRGIFSRSPRSIYHYLEITFVCLKFAGPETLLQYWILNAFSHDDDKNT